jgi:hypothetical protein
MRPFLKSPAAASDVPGESDVDRRARSDRRETPTGPCSALPPAGRRMLARRAGEHRLPYFVDRFSPRVFVIVMLFVLASVADALLTIRLIEAGGVEVNPLMARLLDRGVMTFFIGKYLLTVIGLPVLLIFGNTFLFGTRFRVKYLLVVFLALYLVLIGYQLRLTLA